MIKTAESNKTYVRVFRGYNEVLAYQISGLITNEGISYETLHGFNTVRIAVPYDQLFEVDDVEGIKEEIRNITAKILDEINDKIDDLNRQKIMVQEDLRMLLEGIPFNEENSTDETTEAIN